MDRFLGDSLAAIDLKVFNLALFEQAVRFGKRHSQPFTQLADGKKLHGRFWG